MKLASLGLNHLVSLSATLQTVRPRSSALSSGHLRIAPPQPSSTRPRWRAYQAASSLWLVFDLKNTPPIPVTFGMARLWHDGEPGRRPKRPGYCTVATGSYGPSG